MRIKHGGVPWKCSPRGEEREWVRRGCRALVALLAAAASCPARPADGRRTDADVGVGTRMANPPNENQALPNAVHDAEANFGDNQVGQVVDPCPSTIQVAFAPHTPPPEPGVGAKPSPFLLENGGITVECNFTEAPFASQGRRVGNDPLLYEALAPCNPGTRVLIHITLPPFKPGGAPALEMWLMFEVERNKLLTPLTANDNKTTTMYTRHPRVRAIEPRPGLLPRVWVDITFIEATDIVRNTTAPPGPGLPALSLLCNYDGSYGTLDDHCPEPTANGSKQSPDSKTLHHDCELHIYEMTMGKPRAWAVVVPKAARTGGSTCNVLVFFQPTEGREYTGVLDCPCYQKWPHLPRYTRDPQDEGPFYYQTINASSPEMLQFFKTAQWAGSSPPTTEQLAEMQKRYWQWSHPPTGFEGQLAASGKAVVLAMPFPHGATNDYGVAQTNGFGYLMSALGIALAADGALSEEKAGIERISVTRKGVSGFSVGAGNAQLAFGQNQGSVKELYLFDHLSFDSLDKDTIRAWLKRGDTRLCLVGGRFLSSAIRLKSQFPASQYPNVFLTPEDPSFFDTPGNIWAVALFPPARAGAWETGPRTLSDAGTGTATSYSAKSNVYLTRTNPLSLTLGTPTGVSHAVHVTSVEAAALVRQWQVPQGPPDTDPYADRPVENSGDLGSVSDAKAQEVIDNLRHQWTVQGGIGTAARFPYGPQDQTNPDGAAFEGYLHFCLKHSAFP